MNTYVFLQTSRKEPPYLAHTVRANTPEEAIKEAKYFPYDPADWDESDEENDEVTSQEDRIKTVHAYYGLIPGKSAYDAGNGPDGYGTVLVEVSMEGHETKLYPSDKE